MPTLRPAVFRARYHFSEVARIADLAALIDRIAARGTHGLFLKAPDEPEIAAAVDRVVARGVPGRHARHRCRQLPPRGLCRHGQSRRRRDGRLSHRRVARRREGEDPGDVEQQPFPRRGGARDRLSSRAPNALPQSRHCRSQRRSRHRPGDRRARAQGARRQPRHCRAPIRSAAATALWSKRSGRWRGRARCSSATISTRTILRFCARGGFRRCCITICAPTCARPVAS